MKIEVGESLMRSWLRHIQGCQFAELNWKPSSSWPVCSDVQPLMDAARDHFKSALAADIFGTQTAYQLLKQGEIDVLGIRINPDGEVVRVCSVDMAFHEGGLNYGALRRRAIAYSKNGHSLIHVGSASSSLPAIR